MGKFLAALAVPALAMATTAAATTDASPAGTAPAPGEKQATDKPERLVSPRLDRFVLHSTIGDAHHSTVKRVPAGQTANTWTRMITTQRFTGVAARMTPSAYARVLANEVLPHACKNAIISPIEELTVSGRPATEFQADCPRHPSGTSETALVLIVAGQQDMFVTQVALRDAPALDLVWARHYLSETVYCTPNDLDKACS